MGQVGAGPPRGAESGKHSCWPHADEETFRRDAGRFVQHGLDAGEQVITVGDWNEPEELRSLASVRMSLDTVYLSGELDSSTLHLVDLALDETEGDVAVDLTAVEFMDLRSFERPQRFVVKAESAGRSVRLQGVPKSSEDVGLCYKESGDRTHPPPGPASHGRLLRLRR